MDKRKRPLLLTLSMWYFGIGILPIIIAAYIGCTEETMYINGVLRDNVYFMKNYLLWLLVGVISCAFFAWSIKKEKWWFQHIPPLVCSLFLFIGLIKAPSNWQSLTITYGVIVGITIWYFYYRQNVREYFALLKKESIKRR